MKPKSFLRNLTLIHASLCLGLAIFASFAYFKKGDFKVAVDTDVFVYIVPIIAMIGYFGSKFIYQNLLKNIPQSETLVTKLNRYQAASLVKYAFIEGPAFLALFAYYSSGNAIHIIIAISLTLYLFFQRPTLAKIKNDVPLNIEENKEFDTV